jgi:5'-deoxynucleotidase YfbR-like HD superfamily hydrolase
MILNTYSEYGEGKDEILENKIVKFADILQALSYTMSELHLGNTYLKHISNNLLITLEKKYGKDKYFSSYVKEILEFVKENLD